MTEDSGYSNYTVLETTATCLKKANPALPCEESYSWHQESGANCKEMCVAVECPHFAEGQQLHFDVDGETTIADYMDDPELVAAYEAYNAPTPEVTP